MENPDSLLTAARKLADIIGRPWAAVQPYYKALQEPDEKDGTGWLPKSLGRNIWYANANFIARLLIAVSATPNPAEAHGAMDWARNLTPGGRKRYLTEEPAANVPILIEEHFYRYLTDPDAASELSTVEVNPDEKKIIFKLKTGKTVEYACPNESFQNADTPEVFSGICYRGVISGFVFVQLAKSINWRYANKPPMRKASQGEVSQED